MCVDSLSVENACVDNICVEIMFVDNMRVGGGGGRRSRCNAKKQNPTTHCGELNARLAGIKSQFLEFPMVLRQYKWNLNHWVLAASSCKTGCPVDVLFQTSGTTHMFRIYIYIYVYCILMHLYPHIYNLERDM